MYASALNIDASCIRHLHVHHDLHRQLVDHLYYASNRPQSALLGGATMSAAMIYYRDTSDLHYIWITLRSLHRLPCSYE